MSDSVLVFESLQWVYEYVRKVNPSEEDLKNWLQTQMYNIANGSPPNPRQAMKDLEGGLF